MGRWEGTNVPPFYELFWIFLEPAKILNPLSEFWPVIAPFTLDLLYFKTHFF